MNRALIALATLAFALTSTTGSQASTPQIKSDTNLSFESCSMFSCPEPAYRNYTSDGKSFYASAVIEDNLDNDPNWEAYAIYKYEITTKTRSLVVPKHECSIAASAMAVGDTRTCYKLDDVVLSPDQSKIYYRTLYYSQKVTSIGQMGPSMSTDVIGRATHSIYDIKTQTDTNLSEKYQLADKGATVNTAWAPDSKGIYVESAIDAFTPAPYFVDLVKNKALPQTYGSYYTAISRNGKYGIQFDYKASKVYLKTLATGKSILLKGFVPGFGHYVPLNDGKNVIWHWTSNVYSINAAGKKKVLTATAGLWSTITPDQKSIVFQKINDSYSAIGTFGTAIILNK